ncbi:MAG: efflux RND transporter periplasmic adaptor subunit [Proteobacteria bacterium]|nr:efflux RND transporter periplasmic adaptor subunit [Pseudomonadota bacterium]
MRKLWLVGGVAVVIAAGVAFGVVSRAKSGGPSAEAKKPADVALEFTNGEVAHPKLLALPEHIEFSGALMAPRTAIVRAKASGTLLDLKVAEGSRVTAGQPLGSIDLADLQSRAAERSAMVDQAQAKLTEAERSYKANEDLAGQHFISSTALDTSRATLDSARAQLKSAQAQLDTSRVGIRDAALVAPINGVIGKRNVVPGEKVSAEQELMTIVDLRSLELAGIVGTHQVSMLRAGQPVAVRVEGQSSPVVGRIDRIAPTVEPGTRGIRVVVVLDNPKEIYRAGQYASAEVVLDDQTQRLTLPATAVGQESGQDFVWTVEKGALVRRIVITGRRDQATNRVEVSKGLSADMVVLAARFDNLKEGTAAKVVAQRVAPTASAASSAPAGERS